MCRMRVQGIKYGVSDRMDVGCNTDTETIAKRMNVR